MRIKTSAPSARMYFSLLSLGSPGMRTVGAVFVLGVAALFLQGTVLRAFLPEGSVVPNLMLTIVAYLAFHEVSSLGVGLAFMLGFLFDLSSGSLLGPWAGAFVVVYAVLSSATQRIFTDSPLTAFVAVLIGSLVSQMVYLVILLQFRASELTVLSSSLQILLEALLSAFCAPLCFGVFRRFRLAKPSRVG